MYITLPPVSRYRRVVFALPVFTVYRQREEGINSFSSDEPVSRHILAKGKWNLRMQGSLAAMRGHQSVSALTHTGEFKYRGRRCWAYPMDLTFRSLSAVQQRVLEVFEGRPNFQRLVRLGLLGKNIIITLSVFYLWHCIGLMHSFTPFIQFLKCSLS